MPTYTISIAEKLLEMGLNISEITPEQFTALDMALSQLADVAYSECVRLANERLHKTALDYKKALKYHKEGGGNYQIELDGAQVHLNDGYPSYDQKPGLLHGPNAKISAKGVPYNIIPIKAEDASGVGGKTQFRVVTGNSPANSWIHPGFEGAHILEDVAAYLDEQLENIIMDIMGA